MHALPIGPSQVLIIGPRVLHAPPNVLQNGCQVNIAATVYCQAGARHIPTYPTPPQILCNQCPARIGLYIQTYILE